ncbi:hypothetical protein Sps_04711 [Shewanella psychrophila]|uniref:Uncharacterized protein n=1 Tax=Shewanella psychrophila TaxID=225848 RepID=A0A1S6HWI5_9GAMM|nr:hypothetical protein [Shewanella psychrophila]AQS39794.1 hypothetical protein Sps_04711 [Shewanella psychrophila]
MSDESIVGYAAKIDGRVMAMRQGHLIFFSDQDKLFQFIAALSVKEHEVGLHGLGFDFIEMIFAGNEGLFLDAETYLKLSKFLRKRDVNITPTTDGVDKKKYYIVKPTVELLLH